AEPLALAVRKLAPADLERVIQLDARHRGAAVPEYWQRVRTEFLVRDRSRFRVALGAESAGRLAGFLLGEVRAFEFGSEPCGWIFAVGVEPGRMREGIASRLLAEACRRFRAAGIATVRTMVRRSDVPVLAFFRAHGFHAGAFTQLELDLAEEEDTER
ncbi:MAG TPA: GNAT family N-acetyltransferase, partial [Thermoanaerobaculia bacterium]|nr:GNAT family N-acetyltransferase [Thermoanaerobaculia bacterium]